MLIVYYLIFNKTSTSYIFFTYYGICLIAIFESVVIFLQSAGLMPVSNESFLCTGTWVNPNVTAMFLAMSLFAIIETIKTWRKPFLGNLILITVVIAILLLYSRTAYLITSIFLVYYFNKSIKNFISGGIKLTSHRLGQGVLAIILILIFVSPFVNKTESSSGRLAIWRNSLQLVAQNPILGYGHGSFEKNYNLYAASLKKPENSHVFMAYNDFIELTFESGLPALLLWLACLYYFFRFCTANKRSVLPIVALVIIQATNFGFQAYPAFILFIIYMAAGNVSLKKDKVIASNNASVKNSFSVAKIWLSGLSAFSILFFIEVSKITGAYYQQKIAHDNFKSPYAFMVFQDLKPLLEFSNGFHENFGDVLLARKQFSLALIHYKQALKTCSRPVVFAKCGYVHSIIKNYDSSRHYYQIVQDIEPGKLVPRMALLKLYQQAKDTSLIISKANEIVDFPMKVVTKKGSEIKAYAKDIINKIDSIQMNSKYQPIKKIKQIK